MPPLISFPPRLSLHFAIPIHLPYSLHSIVETLYTWIDRTVRVVSLLIGMTDSQMQETMETLCENVASLIETLDKRFKSIKETVQSIDGRFKLMEGSAQSIQEQIDINTQNICNKLEEVRKELKSDIRNLYKAVVRPSIAEKYGLRYAESLCLEDCYGLARLVAPKSKTSLEETEGDDVLTVHQQRAFKIAYRVKDGNLIDKLKDKIDSYNREMAKLKESDPTITYNEYFKLTKDAEKLIAEWETGKDIRWLATSNLLIMAITAHFLDQEKIIEYKEPPFYSRLDIDVRGKVSTTVDGDKKIYVHLELGEVRSSNSNDEIRHGYRQLAITLRCIEYACKAIFGDNGWCAFRGRLFVPKKTSECILKEEWIEDIIKESKYSLDFEAAQ